MSRRVRMLRDWVVSSSASSSDAKPGEDPRRVERCTAGRRRLAQPFAERGVGDGRIHQLGRCRRDDVDAGLEEPLVVRDGARAALRSARGVHDAVGLEADQRVDVARRGDPEWRDARELARVVADLLRCVHPDADQIEVGARGDCSNGVRADAAGGPDHDSTGIAWHELAPLTCS